MRRTVLAALAALMLAATLPAYAAETRLADPPPDPDNPRKVMLQLTTDDPRAVNDLLYNAVNIQKFYGQDNVRVAVVAFGPGNRALYKDTSPVRARVESLLQYEVEFIACGNTIDAQGRAAGDVIDGVEIVGTGIAEIMERQLQGWLYVRP